MDKINIFHFFILKYRLQMLDYLHTNWANLTYTCPRTLVLGSEVLETK